MTDFAIYPSLKGKTVFITGGASGIGAEIVKAFAAQGARVGFVDFDESASAQLVETTEGEVDYAPCDLRDIDALRRAFDKLVAQIGPAAVLVNNAARDDRHDWRSVTPEYWDERMNTNLRHMFFACQKVAPGMIAAGGGSIINMSSVASSLKGVPNRFAYCASKAAVIGLTKSVAADFVARGIRCNAICPGTVDSPSLHDRLRATGDYDQAMTDFIARQPMGRIGSAEEVAELALYLASDASKYTTGQPFAIDGGWTI